MADVQNNIEMATITNAYGVTIELFTPSDTDVHAKYANFIPSYNAWDGLATIPIADELFETDNTTFRAQIGKMQYAPRQIVITGWIATPKKDDAATAYHNRCFFLREIQSALSQRGWLSLSFRVTRPAVKTYTLYCHLHGADAIRVKKYPEHYEISIALIAEDPLFYEQEPTTYTTDVYNYGDVEQYADIILRNCKGIDYYEVTTDDGVSRPVRFISPIESDEVKIHVEYPNQICSIEGTSISNIDLSEYDSNVFLKVPLGHSKWPSIAA